MFVVPCVDVVYAYEKVAGRAAQLSLYQPQNKYSDARIQILENYLTYNNSPAVDSAQYFIKEADRLEMDWKLVVAISGVESGFCKQIPTNSNNCWGWGYYSPSAPGIHFSTLSDGISKVSEGLKRNYIDKNNTTVDQIGRVYAASPTWATRVKYYMQGIDNWKIQHAPNSLEITI